MPFAWGLPRTLSKRPCKCSVRVVYDSVLRKTRSTLSDLSFRVRPADAYDDGGRLASSRPVHFPMEGGHSSPSGTSEVPRSRPPTPSPGPFFVYSSLPLVCRKDRASPIRIRFDSNNRHVFDRKFARRFLKTENRRRRMYTLHTTSNPSGTCTFFGLRNVSTASVSLKRKIQRRPDGTGIVFVLGAGSRVSSTHVVGICK